MNNFRTDYWYAAGGDAAFRFSYPLHPESVVFDVGGYQGDWAAPIVERYGCRLYVFEPVPEYYDAICRRFFGVPGVRIYPFGLAVADGAVKVAIAGASTSALLPAGDSAAFLSLRSFSRFCSEEGISRIDLLKLNIEGGEYRLVENIIESGFINQIGDLQIQFHDFVPDSDASMRSIRMALARTHYPTYLFDYVWENWRRQDRVEDAIVSLADQITWHGAKAIALLERVTDLDQKHKALEQILARRDQELLAIKGLRAYRVAQRLARIIRPLFKFRNQLTASSQTAKPLKSRRPE